MGVASRTEDEGTESCRISTDATHGAAPLARACCSPSEGPSLELELKRPGANERALIPLLPEARLGVEDLFTAFVPLSLPLSLSLSLSISLSLSNCCMLTCLFAAKMSFSPYLKHGFGIGGMVSLLSKRRSDSGADRGRYIGVFSKWAVIFLLYTGPLIHCLLGLCGYPYYWFQRCPGRNFKIRADAIRRSLLFSSIPVEWRQQAYDYVPEF